MQVLVLTLGVMIAVELAAQVRAQLTTGHSVFVPRRPDFVRDEARGLTLMRPNADYQAIGLHLKTNRQGLRSDDLSPVKGADETRIALIGASTVMGATTPEGAQTIASHLESRLREAQPGARLHVINAGFIGTRVQDHVRMLEYVSDELAPDIAVEYSGNNHFLDYCPSRVRSDPQAQSYSLPQIRLPSGLLSTRLLSDNVPMLRLKVRQPRNAIDPAAIDLSGYKRALQALVRTANARQIRIVLVTNAHQERSVIEASPERERLTASMLDEIDCLDLAGMDELYVRNNQVLRETAAEMGVQVVDLAQSMAARPDLFDDGRHFNVAGNRFAAARLAEALVVSKPSSGPASR